MFWCLLLRVLKALPLKPRASRQRGRPPVDMEGGAGGGGFSKDPRVSLYWAAHQRFFKCMLIAAKVGWSLCAK
jgi:hypothetical protein